MQTLFFVMRSDVSKVLAATLGNMGSLLASEQSWARFVNALGWEVEEHLKGALPEWPDLQAEADRIVAESVPEENFPHPQRAEVITVDTVGRPTVVFETPAEVEITISASTAGVEVDIVFNRNSKRLATLIASALFALDVKGSAALLACASAEAAEAEAETTS